MKRLLLLLASYLFLLTSAMAVGRSGMYQHSVALTGYGTANVEWGRTRNIDGIPGLMIIKLLIIEGIIGIYCNFAKNSE